MFHITGRRNLKKTDIVKNLGNGCEVLEINHCLLQTLYSGVSHGHFSFL